MKMLKKLALVSAISMISAGSFAMEAMDEDTMSATTGQDGITINIVPDRITRTEATAMGVTAPTMDQISAGAPAYKGLSIGEIRVHDDDGYDAEGTATHNSGALVIGGAADAEDLDNDGDTLDAGESAAERTTANRTVLLAKGDKPIQINVDMIGDADAVKGGNQAMLRVEIKQPALAIKLGNIYVANSNASTATRDENGLLVGTFDVDGSTVTDKVKILDGLEIVMAESTMIIRLGNEDSSNNMITANATLTGGLTINNFKLYDESGAAALTADNLLTGDVGSGGNIRATSIKITNTLNGDLTTVTGIDVGSRIGVSTVTVGGASETAYKDAAAKKASSGTFNTYADAQTAAAGAPGPLQVAGAATVAGVNAATTYANGLVNGAADGVNTLTETNTWGGVDTYNGLVITSQLGDAGGANIAINNLALGDSNASVMGDVQILGLKLGTSKIVIMGH